MGKRGRVVAVVLAVVVLVAVVVVGHRVWNDRHRTDLSRALDTVPSETRRLAFTDWQSVRSALGVKAGTDPSDDTIKDMISRAYDNDLSSASSIETSAVALQKNFGFSPATIEWEAFAQSDTGATMVVRMPDGFDFDTVRGHLSELGFTKPSGKNDVWVGGVDLVAAIDPTITPELQYVAVLADKHLIVTSDTESYAKKAAAVAGGKGASLGDLNSARQTVAPLDEPAAAMLWTRDFACSDLSMSQADKDSQDTADALVTAAGKITPLSGLAMALSPERHLSVSERFADGDAAKENLTARAKLAVGEAPGRGGSFSDDLELKSSTTKGSTVQLQFAPRADTGFLLSALSTGPVLFATC